MKNIKKYWIVIIIVILGILTLIPVSSNKVCYLGYDSCCTFTPISTIILWSIAGILYWKIKKGQGREIEKKEI
jgi:uncharacterized membrane protein